MKKLIIGATGNVGTYVVRKLVELNNDVVIATSNIGRAKQRFKEYKNITLVWFDFYEHKSFKKALNGVGSVFFIRPPKIGDPHDIYPFIDYLKKINIDHTVFMSLMGVEKNPIPPHSKIEKYIKRNSLNYTFIRPGFFMENLIYPHGKDIKELNKIIIPASTAKTSFITAEDIGQASAVCMNEGSKHFNKAYTLTGKSALNYYEVASIMGEVLKKKIIYTKPNYLKYRKHMLKNGFDKGYVTVTLFLYLMTRLGTAKNITNDVQKILKREPISLKEFVEKNKVIWI